MRRHNALSHKVFSLPCLAGLLLGGTDAVVAAELQQLETVTVSAPALASEASDAFAPAVSLSDVELRNRAATTLGATLEREGGVSNASFGPGVGQPIIRGQGGARVQVLQNGLGSRDVSAMSPDHASSTEPLLAERIELLRGPATLLYGSGLIGGAVNVQDGRVPEQAPEKGYAAAFEQRYDSALEQNASVLRLDAGKGPLAVHADGFYRDSGDVRIDGHAAFDGSGPNGRIPNSRARAKSGSAGLSWVGDAGFLGVAVNRLENTYGVPPADEPHQVNIDLEQSRYDLKGELRQPFALTRKLRFSLAHTDYQHVELEGGAAASKFLNETTEGRLEWHHEPAGPLSGLWGMQVSGGTLNSLGEEAILPKTDTANAAGFALETLDLGAWTWQFALRGERQRLTPEGQPAAEHVPISGSTAATWHWSDKDSVTLGFSRSERAPQAAELYSDGVHHATHSYERGSAGLRKEAGHNLELGLKMERDGFRARLDLYHNWVNDYIYGHYTGELFDHALEDFNPACTGDCVPVLEYRQRAATFKGYEAQVVFPLGELAGGGVDLTLFSDYVRGAFTNGEDVPRLPPLRFGSQLDYRRNGWSAYTRVAQAEPQNHPGVNETATAGYVKLDLGARYTLQAGQAGELTVFANAKNLLDADIRSATSYLRQYSPEPGRGAELGIRLSF